MNDWWDQWCIGFRPKILKMRYYDIHSILYYTFCTLHYYAKDFFFSKVLLYIMYHANIAHCNAGLVKLLMNAPLYCSPALLNSITKV